MKVERTNQKGNDFNKSGGLMKRNMILGVFMAIAAVLIFAPAVFAYSIDYLAANISAPYQFSGSSGNYQITEPVNPGDTITFDLTFSIIGKGNTSTFPRPVEFGVQNSNGDPAVTLNPSSFTFSSASSSFTTRVTIVASSVPGAYHVKIAPINGVGGGSGLSGESGILVHFTVADSCSPDDSALSLTVTPACILYHSTSNVTLSAALTSGGAPVSGQIIDFTVDSNNAGSVGTGSDGIASTTYYPASLAVGDHTVVASFEGQECLYNGSSDSKTLGVTYMFLGFQQPINTDGSRVFKGSDITVKIKIADANGTPVTDADAHVYFTFISSAILGTSTEQPATAKNNEPGNTMRYDPSADQYIFNWDVTGLANGTYSIRIDLGEGSCGEPHTVVVSIARKVSK